MPALNFQSLKLSKTTEEFNQSVCQNVNTNLTKLEEDVQVLREWLKTQHHLPQCSSDTMLKAYILASKNQLEKAKAKIENYYITRAEMSDVYSNRDPTSEKITEDGAIVNVYTLPQLSPDGCRVVSFAFTSGERKFDVTAFTKRVLMIEDIRMNCEAFIKGHYIVFDGTHLSMSHVLKFTPRVVRQLVHCGQDVLPLIIKGIIFINAPAYIEIVLTIMKPFMKGKLFQRVHVHTKGAEVLEKYFPTSLLPKDYGGEEECTSYELNESWMKSLRDNRDWFMTVGELKADVNKNKVESPVKCGEFEEMQGSFKTLCID